MVGNLDDHHVDIVGERIRPVVVFCKVKLSVLTVLVPTLPGVIWPIINPPLREYAAIESESTVVGEPMKVLTLDVVAVMGTTSPP